MIHSYPSVYQIGHKAIELLFGGEVLVEEKVDGSQFSFGVLDGELTCRSKGKIQIIDAPDKMFNKAVATIKEFEPNLHPNWTYRCEYLEKPKHNTLCYSRTPAKNLIGYDIMTENAEEYLSYEEKKAEFERIGLEIVPMFYQGKIDSFEVFKSLLETESILGGTLIEGVVVKNYTYFTMEKKPAMGKYVSERFKEVHATDWNSRNPTGADIVTQVITEYKTDARWNKAIQHLREQGLITDTPKDIGALIGEVSKDVYKECVDEIKQRLFDHYWKQIQRGVTSGLPEWYKDKITQSAFEEHSA
jgi:hypothetical protein